MSNTTVFTCGYDRMHGLKYFVNYFTMGKLLLSILESLVKI